MDTLTFTSGDMEITVRPHTGRDIIWWRVMFAKLDKQTADYDFWRQMFDTLVCILTQTVSVKGELGFALPPPSADLATIQTFGNQLLERWPLFKAWEEAVTVVDIPANSPDLLPPEMLTEEQKKTKT